MAYEAQAICKLSTADILAAALGRRTDADSREAFSFGIEEEYFLADATTGALASVTPDSFFESANVATGGSVDREFLQSQVEVAIPPHGSMAEARTELSYVRQVVAQYAAAHGLCILACGTHPTGSWEQSVQSQKHRYDKVMDDLQIVGRRNLLCGMHVHVAIPDPARRVELMRRMIPYLPLFIALSTSSPFWESHLTGLKGYRLAAYDELPRSGIPELFSSEHEYDAYVEALINAKAIDSASYLWWTLRPSAKYPTLELRAPDCCTRLSDAMAIAALFRVLIRHFFLTPHPGPLPDAVSRALAVENKWSAQRHGLQATFATEEGPASVSAYLERTLNLIEEDVLALSCAEEVEQCRVIVAKGTSADFQIDHYRANASVHGHENALTSVIDWIARTTIEL